MLKTPGGLIFIFLSICCKTESLIKCQGDVSPDNIKSKETIASIAFWFFSLTENEVHDIMPFVPGYGLLAQLVEHIVHIDGVTGSSPVQTT